VLQAEFRNSNSCPLAELPHWGHTFGMSSVLPSEPSLSVSEAAARVGLTAATLRTWDRRYGLSPSIRTSGGHRRYNSADLQRLEVAAELVQAGHPAAEAVAASSLPQIGQRTPSRTARAGGGRVLKLPDGNDQQRGLARAAMALNGDAISEQLVGLIRQHGVISTWQEVIVPVLVAVGDRWARTGDGIDVEHTLAVGVSSALMSTTPERVGGSRPVLLACADKEEHVLPLLALHSALLSTGTPSVMLGSKMPLSSLAGAVSRVRPRKVAIWAQLEQAADPQLPQQLPALRPPAQVVLLGPGWCHVDLDCPHPSSLADAVDELAYAR
jgi:DNA-binding transcriptional MerR regulator